MTVEICHTTHMLYVVLHSKSIVEENAELNVTKLNVRYIKVVLDTRQTYQYSVSFISV